MQKLIIILFYLLGQHGLFGQGYLKQKVIVLDDCAKWKQSDRYNGPPGLFFIYKNQFENEKHDYVRLSNIHYGYEFFPFQYYEEPPYQILYIRLSSIKEECKIFSSELSYADWMEIDVKNDKIFIIHPKDFCTGRSFDHRNIFKVYEVKILAPYPIRKTITGDIGDPMRFFRIDSSKVRNRKKD